MGSAVAGRQRGTCPSCAAAWWREEGRGCKGGDMLRAVAEGSLLGPRGRFKWQWGCRLQVLCGQARDEFLVARQLTVPTTAAGRLGIFQGHRYHHTLLTAVPTHLPEQRLRRLWLDWQRAMLRTMGARNSQRRWFRGGPSQVPQQSRRSGSWRSRELVHSPSPPLITTAAVFKGS